MSFYPAPPSFSSVHSGPDSDFAMAGFVKGLQYSHTEQMPERSVGTRMRNRDTTRYNTPQVFSTHLSQEYIASITGPMNDRMRLHTSNYAVQIDANHQNWDLGTDHEQLSW